MALAQENLGRSIAKEIGKVGKGKRGVSCCNLGHFLTAHAIGCATEKDKKEGSRYSHEMPKKNTETKRERVHHHSPVAAAHGSQHLVLRVHGLRNAIGASMRVKKKVRVIAQ